MKKNKPAKPPKPADKEVWHRVARTVAPLRKGSSKPKDKTLDWYMHVEGLKPARPFAPLVSPGTRADKKTRRGKIDIQSKADLHDLTAPQAFEALRRSVIRAYNQNHQCLLVVTGKGVRGQGVLRQSLPTWLEHEDIRPVISEYAPAHQRHGGTGAWYVFLKTKSS